MRATGPTDTGPEVQAAVARSVLALGLVAYTSFAPVFLWYGLYDIAALNVGIAVGFVVALVMCQRGWVASTVGYGAVAVVVHGLWCTWRLGWDAGFHYPILLGVLAQSLVSTLPFAGRVGTAAACGLVYLALWPLSRGWAPGVDPATVDVFEALNLGTFAFLLLFIALFHSRQIELARAARTEAEDALKHSLDQSRAVLEHMADGLIAVDGEGRTRGFNKSLERMLGGRSIPDELTRLVETAAGSGDIQSGEIPLSDKRVGAAIASPLPDGRGVVALVRDVTREREVDRMKTEFTATVSHELRTPLTSILGFARMIQNRLERRILPGVDLSDPKARKAVDQVEENLQIILSEGKRLSLLINDVLDIAKMESGSMLFASDPVDVPALVEAARSASAGLFVKRPVELTTSVQPGLPTLVGDRDRLQQVLVNLISNASKFTDEGSVRLDASAGDGVVRLTVRDTGPGIPEAELEAVFDRFHQVGDGLVDRPQGTGLGLPICRHIVEAHGGTIWAESTPGEGATFIVELPSGS